MRIILILTSVFIFSVASFTFAQGEDPAHTELRLLRDELIASVENGDIEKMALHLHPTIVITWQDGEVCRGIEEVKKFYARMKAGNKKFEGYKVPPTADALTTLHAGGTTGVVTGYNIGQYFLLGKEIELSNRWTATVVRENGQWLLAGYHVSMNVLDNPLLNSAKTGGAILAGITLLAGFGSGWWLARRKVK